MGVQRGTHPPLTGRHRLANTTRARDRARAAAYSKRPIAVLQADPGTPEGAPVELAVPVRIPGA